MAKTDDDPAGKQVRALVAEHGRAVESLLGILEHDPSTREEIWSDVFITAYLRVDRITGLTPQQTRGWLLRTTRNITANSGRRAVTRRRLQARLAESPLDPEPSAEDTYFDGPGRQSGATSEAVAAAWAQLSDTHRQVLELDALGLDGPAVADLLDITALAARSRLMRARQAFLAAYDRSEVADR